MKYNDEVLGLSGTQIEVARLVSRLTPAPLINLYVGAMMIIASPIELGPHLDAWTAFFICVVIMVAAPVTPIIISAYKGFTDLDVASRESRPRFFLFSLACYGSAFLIYHIAACYIMSSLAAAYFTVTASIMLVTFRTKVSVHGAGVGGPGTALIYVFGLMALPVILVWLAVIWARPVLKQHTVPQTILGVVIGIAVTSLTYYLLYP